ncbi:ABC transporter substrate-binding protein [Nocardia sp. NPDC049220]|uniref:ABC transporter substrate-binding protein n=1 Tax=Nocardia sp. NPDC049220 TaxID=3155273 RepID=UPI003404A442
MRTIDLAYVGRGLHEELTAYIADQEDYYADEGVHVALRDGCAWDDRRLRRGATIGLGRALLSRLTSGIPWVALTVNTQRPLFWFLARPGLSSLADLAGRRLAVHAPHTAPGCFARIVLRTAGLDPDQDIHCVVRAPGDYGMDLRHLRDGTIDAAFVGSTVAPAASPPSTAGRCWPGSATTSRSPPWAWPSTPPKSSRTTPRSRRSCELTGGPCT